MYVECLFKSSLVSASLCPFPSSHPPCKMSHTNYKYRALPQTDYKYGAAAQEVENHRKKSAMPCEGDGPISLFTVPEVKQVAMRSPDFVRSITKIKLLSFLLGLTLMFLVMTSYILTWDKKGRQVTPSPVHLTPTTVHFSNLPSSRTPPVGEVDLELLMETVGLKLRISSPRRVPALKDVLHSDLHLFSVIPRQFLPNVKSPCWYEEHVGNTSADVYDKNLYAPHSVNFRTVCDHLRRDFREHLYHNNSKLYRLRCLPYFYIIGQPKSGTTDLYHRLMLHPEVRFSTMKEPHWWTRKRFGIIRLKDEARDRFPVEDYIDLFDLAAYHIQDGFLGNASDGHSNQQIVTGEASASTMWDSLAGSCSHGDGGGWEPHFLVQDFIHAAQPDAKLIIMLRDPVERLYSDYLYFHLVNKSAERFHHKVCESLQMFQSCLAESSIRSCIYNTHLFYHMPVRLSLGLYIIYLLDWLTVFHKDQILILRLEDYAANLRTSMHRVFDFLSLSPLSEHRELLLAKKPMSNTRRAQDRSLGPMLALTRSILQRFYQPFNQHLAQLLDNQAFLWTDT
ncbi:carbohydrate sulfotransferase 15-like [Osmerus mordax]|uniref:carbohydrate sulfotransferase 15-like n=1 Tax=Osmerus mordax TaxID=8014 RepID=UPI003510690B